MANLKRSKVRIVQLSSNRQPSAVTRYVFRLKQPPVTRKFYEGVHFEFGFERNGDITPSLLCGEDRGASHSSVHVLGRMTITSTTSTWVAAWIKQDINFKKRFIKRNKKGKFKKIFTSLHKKRFLKKKSSWFRDDLIMHWLTKYTNKKCITRPHYSTTIPT